MSDEWVDPRRDAFEAQLESLRLSMWCYEHHDVLFFCDHKHDSAGRP